jgi:biotin carboxylase
MSGQRILLMGGSHSELPLIKAARGLGLEVISSGNRPDHPGHALASEYFAADFSKPDEMIEVARRSRCDFIVSAANDYAYLSACEVAQRLQLPGFDPVNTAYQLHHKHLFKPLAAALGLPVTRFATLENDDLAPSGMNALRYPLVVKPVDLTGGKGISVVSTPEELPAAIQNARRLSKSPSLVIEEFFKGSLHSYSAIIENGEVVFDYADNEYCHPTPYLVSTSTSIAAVPLHVFADLRFQTQKLAGHLELVDGILHCQFLYGGGDYVILEYTRRCSGDLYSSVVQAVTGLHHAEQFIRQSVQLPLNLSRQPPAGDFIARHCVFASQAGRFNGIEVHPTLAPYVLSVTEALPHGTPFHSGWKEKAAVVILRFPTQESMLDLRPQFNQLIDCQLTELVTEQTPGIDAECQA